MPEPATLVLLAGVVLFTSIAKSAFASALGLVSVPILMLVFPPQQALGILLPILCLIDVFTLKAYWRKWDVKLLVSLIPGALLGIALGSVILIQIPAEAVRFLLAAMALVFSIRFFTQGRIQWQPTKGRAAAVIMSGLSGIGSTLAHAGSPPITIYLASKGIKPKRFIGTATAFYALMNLVKLGPFMLTGILSVEYLLIAMSFAPLAVIGTLLGCWVKKRVKRKVFFQVIHFILLITGIKLLFF